MQSKKNAAHVQKLKDGFYAKQVLGSLNELRVLKN